MGNLDANDWQTSFRNTEVYDATAFYTKNPDIEFPIGVTTWCFFAEDESGNKTWVLREYSLPQNGQPYYEESYSTYDNEGNEIIRAIEIGPNNIVSKYGSAARQKRRELAMIANAVNPTDFDKTKWDEIMAILDQLGAADIIVEKEPEDSA